MSTASITTPTLLPSPQGLEAGTTSEVPATGTVSSMDSTGSEVAIVDSDWSITTDEKVEAILLALSSLSMLKTGAISGSDIDEVKKETETTSGGDVSEDRNSTVVTSSFSDSGEAHKETDVASSSESEGAKETDATAYSSDSDSGENPFIPGNQAIWEPDEDQDLFYPIDENRVANDSSASDDDTKLGFHVSSGPSYYGMRKNEEEKLARIKQFSIKEWDVKIVNEDGKAVEKGDSTESFRNDYIHVAKSRFDGLGMFAHLPIAAGTPILVERELFKCHSTSDVSTQLSTLSPVQLSAYRSLHGYKQRYDEDLDIAIFRTNSFQTIPPLPSIVLLVGSRFNHACDPLANVQYHYMLNAFSHPSTISSTKTDTKTLHTLRSLPYNPPPTILPNSPSFNPTDPLAGHMVFKTSRDIAAGEELFNRYAHSPEALFYNWGFRCECGACGGITEEHCFDLRPDYWSSTEEFDW
ncbi:hypothetical protein F5Y18DRAFT_424710 [Xylariaceae sp. FL1019]|nr:hypothetical protein F5Y18DRAFT_424710 [Xylariaceae sp. FL1019]